MKPTKDMRQLGIVIREAREAKGLSARKVAQRCGLDHSFISKLEANTYREISLGSLMALAKALDVPAEDLFALAGYKAPEALPSFGPYLRARYGEELPESARAALTEVFDSFRRNYVGSDEVDDEDAEDAHSPARSTS